jgi:hypothetical protein
MLPSKMKKTKSQRDQLDQLEYDLKRITSSLDYQTKIKGFKSDQMNFMPELEKGFIPDFSG